MKDKRKRDTGRCYDCGVVKTKKNTQKKRSARDGLYHICRKCAAVRKRVYRKLEKEKKQPAIGIESRDQVDSILRELSELQFKINTEANLCRKRIAMIEGYSQEIIDPCIGHQIGLRTMLEDFIKKACREKNPVTKKHRYGFVCLRRGKLVLELKPELAGANKGKP